MLANTVSGQRLLLDIVGVLLVWKYGLPAVEVLSEGSYVGIQITER